MAMLRLKIGAFQWARTLLLSTKRCSSEHFEAQDRRSNVPRTGFGQFEPKPKAIPRITIPPRLHSILNEKKTQRLVKEKQQQTKFSGPTLISCSKKQFNHRVGQRFVPHQNQLASAYWKNKKHIGEHFTINAVERNPALQTRPGKGSTKTSKRVPFRAIGLREDICKVLEDYGFNHPTLIQLEAIPALLDGKSVMCTAETGGGKTLAFLLPMIEQIMSVREQQGGARPERNKPIGIVLVPTHELAEQIYDVANDLAEPLGFKVKSIVGRFSNTFLHSRQTEEMDLLIASPGVLSKAFALGRVRLGRLSMLTCDEADSLLDDSFEFIMDRIFQRAMSGDVIPTKRIRENKYASKRRDKKKELTDNPNEETNKHMMVEETPHNDITDDQISHQSQKTQTENVDESHMSDIHESEFISAEELEDYLGHDDVIGDDVTSSVPQETPGLQFCMVGATIPTNVEELLGELVPQDKVQVVKTNHIHCLLPHISQKFYRVESDHKPEMLLEQLKKNLHQNIPTIVFCNKTPTVKYLAHAFEKVGLRSVSVLHKVYGPNAKREGVFDEWHSGKTEILLTTDLASRGLDTTRARMVINYDFPDHMVDYLHRAGRVGRVGSDGTGSVVNYVLHRWDVDLLWQIETAARQNSPVKNVYTNIKRMLIARHNKKPDVVELHV